MKKYLKNDTVDPCMNVVLTLSYDRRISCSYVSDSRLM